MGRIIRYLRIFSLLIKTGLMQQMAYRPHFFSMFAGKVIRIALLLLFFQAVFMKVDRIGSWGYDQVLLLFATFHVVDFLMSITFHRNLAFYLPQKVHSGDFDARMLLPVNLLFLSSLERIELIDFASFLPTLGFLGYVLYRLEFAFTGWQLLVYLILLSNALIFLFAAVLAIATLSFWTTQSSGLARIFDSLLKVGRYPIEIFEGFWRSIFLYILPLVLIAQTPSEALLGIISPRAVLVATAVTGFLLALALLLWRAGLKRYQSASS
ncbi:MAG TPA: ABC-2 family transporter protein [Candidatus Limnocylindrales bacterium]|nr:ABC-2 family transporter protein [Candidatus Limnocylindrales bacterium]